MQVAGHRLEMKPWWRLKVRLDEGLSLMFFFVVLILSKKGRVSL